MTYYLILKDIDGEILHFGFSTYEGASKAARVRPPLIPREYMGFMTTSHMEFISISKEMSS